MWGRRDAGSYPSISGQRQGNTLDGWPVHHRANEHLYIHTLTPKDNLASQIHVSCNFWIVETGESQHGENMESQHRKAS